MNYILVASFWCGILCYRYKICFLVLLYLIYRDRRSIIFFIIAYIRFYFVYIPSKYITINGVIELILLKRIIVRSGLQWFILNINESVNYGNIVCKAQMYSYSNYGSIVKIINIVPKMTFLNYIHQYIMNVICVSPYKNLYILMLFGITTSQFKKQLLQAGIYYDARISSGKIGYFATLMHKFTTLMLSFNLRINYYINIVRWRVIIAIIYSLIIWRFLGFNLSVLYGLIYRILRMISIKRNKAVCFAFILIMFINPYYACYKEFWILFVIIYTRRWYAITGTINVLSFVNFTRYIFQILMIIMTFSIICGSMIYCDYIVHILNSIASYIPNIAIKLQVPTILYCTWFIISVYNIHYTFIIDWLVLIVGLFARFL